MFAASKVGEFDKRRKNAIICQSLRCLRVQMSWGSTTNVITTFATNQSAWCRFSRTVCNCQSTTWLCTESKERPSWNLGSGMIRIANKKNRPRLTKESKQIDTTEKTSKKRWKRWFKKVLRNKSFKSKIFLVWHKQLNRSQFSSNSGN